MSDNEYFEEETVEEEYEEKGSGAGDRLQVTVGRGIAKCAAEKKLCLLFIWLARFFRLSYLYSMEKMWVLGVQK